MDYKAILSPKLFLAGQRGLKKRGSILMYHSVGQDGSFITVQASQLDRQLKYLHEQNGHLFSVAPLSELCERVRSGKPSAGLVAVTFDDAYENFYTLAWPLLKRYKIPATLFVPTGLLGTARTVSDGTRLSVMTVEMLREIVEDGFRGGLVECMPHTETHPDLSAISPEAYDREIAQSRATLENIYRNFSELGSGPKSKQPQACDILAYPKGRTNRKVMEYLAKPERGWKAAVTSSFGLVSASSNRFYLPRNHVGPQTSFDEFRLFLSDRFGLFLAIIKRKKR